MKKRLSTLAVTGLLTIFLNTLPFFATAQDPDPGPCPDCPIDGGLCLLLAAGVGYGVKNHQNRRKQKASILQSKE
jgi:hypothetical protein